jgi:hypothetical protein
VSGTIDLTGGFRSSRGIDATKTTGVSRAQSESAGFGLSSGGRASDFFKPSARVTASHLMKWSNDLRASGAKFPINCRQPARLASPNSFEGPLAPPYPMSSVAVVALHHLWISLGVIIPDCQARFEQVPCREYPAGF